MEATQQYTAFVDGHVIGRFQAHSIWHAQQKAESQWPTFKKIIVKLSKSLKYGNKPRKHN